VAGRARALLKWVPPGPRVARVGDRRGQRPLVQRGRVLRARRAALERADGWRDERRERRELEHGADHVKLGKLTGAASISAPTNPRPGATYVVSWIGDGASVLTFNAAFLSGAAGKSNEILATAVANNKNAMARFYYDGSVYLCELFAVQG
jgi:hypothetical protein